ncbi:MAG TPA: hypothetical protein VL974_05520 [Magnetospirillum sp.]|jgi:hypothetical protein|nr:hypothetical protein [Magnetospirillum sp.]
MLDSQNGFCPARQTHAPQPVEYVVRKDGKPFAILNATPTLAERTLAGFRQAAPAASWSFERI